MSWSQKEELQIYPSCKSSPGLIYNWFLFSAQCPSLLFCQSLMSKVRNWTKTSGKKSLKLKTWPINQSSSFTYKTIWMNTTINLRFLLTIKRGLKPIQNYSVQITCRMFICSCTEDKTDTYSAYLKHQEPLVADIVVTRLWTNFEEKRIEWCEKTLQIKILIIKLPRNHIRLFKEFKIFE